jgi:Xaa-Pro aminopeptidase
LLAQTTRLVSSLRMRKDETEIRHMRRAIAIAQDAIDAAIGQVRIGMSEREFSAVLEFEMKSRGSEAASFTPIIGAGPNSSIIHHMTGPTPIKPGVLLVDWGGVVEGLCSDLTRTFALGQMPSKLAEVYKIVLDAQQKAIAAIRPGKSCAEIDAVARRVITDAGLGDKFGHGLGHGLGMDVHEEPYFNNLQTDVLLEPGMVMTVEPGVYLPGVGGVRIEDDVLITDGGCEVLSNFPKDFESMRIEPEMSQV